MPLIEELPVTTTQRTTQGWAYVPDIKPQAQPLEARKRGRKHASKGEISAKQQKAIQIKLNDLDKENYKDTTISVPAKSKERPGRKITPNIRRILTYHRTFAHYLADEDAQLTQHGNSNALPTLPQTPTLARSGSSRGVKPKQTPMQPPPRPGSARRTPAATPIPNPKRKRSSSSSTITTPSAPQPIVDLEPSTTPQAQAQAQAQAQHQTQPTPNPQGPRTPSSHPLLHPPTSTGTDDKNPLLRSHPTLNLKPPSTHLLTLLLTEPPLSYSASRAQPPQDHSSNSNTSRTHLPPAPKPPRHFCSICGYWGRVKCKRCGERTCGLMECWKGHEGVCSVPDY